MARIAEAMRILFVAIANSIHTARWIGQFSGAGWDLHLFPAQDVPLHAEVCALTYHPPLGSRSARRNPNNSVAASTLLTGPILRRARRWRPGWFSDARRLARVIERVRPDIVHSMEMQQAGYLTQAAMPLVSGERPPWLVTNWGSDIYFFGRIAEHAPKIRRVLQECDYYDCECERDQRAAWGLGFRGSMFPVTPNAGGFDLDRCSRLRTPGPTSKRNLILVKGYQTWSGRAVTALRAIELAADDLRGHKIAVYLADEHVELVAKAVSGSTGLPIEIIPKVPHEEILRHHGAARISLGVSASDGLSTSFLEGLAMGAFPIQSSSAAADEWIEHGRTGLIVDPHNPNSVAAALKLAVRDDHLVDRAVEINDRTARQRLEYSVVQSQAMEMYESIASARRPAKQPPRRAVEQHSRRAA